MKIIKMTNKTGKNPKISELASYDYPSGRIDKFVIEAGNKTNLHKSILGVMNKLEFDHESIEKFDTDMNFFVGYLFGYSKMAKLHLFSSEEEVILIFDSNIEKERLIKIIEQFFSIF